jgi:hypothetical protein
MEQIFDQNRHICLLEALGRSGSPKIKYLPISFSRFWGDSLNLLGSGSEFLIWDPLTLLNPDPKHCLSREHG